MIKSSFHSWSPILLGGLLAIIGLATSTGNFNPTKSMLSVQESNTDDQNNAKKSDSAAHEDLDAVLWVRTSAEYEAIARQTFRAARSAMGDALVDGDWTASVEQQELVNKKGPSWLASLPPAVVMDVDETVLDNSNFQVGLIRSESEYSRNGWKKFVRSKVSTPIPGAVDFVKACKLAGVTVIYVTNREHEVENDTRKNLISAGLLEDSDVDLIFTKLEKDEWTSDKQSRREVLAERFRILLLLGDDLNDFVATEYHASGKIRRDTGDKYKDWFGDKWFALPNPNYGGWEQATYNWENAVSTKTKRKRKREKLRR